MTSSRMPHDADPSDRTAAAADEPLAGPGRGGRRRRWGLALVVVAVPLVLGVAALMLARHMDAVVVALRSVTDRNAPLATAPRLPIVRTAIVAAASGREVSYTGVVHARYESTLGFRVSGKIVERLVDAGDRVHKDQPLMRLDPTDLAQALRAARSEMQAAQAAAIQTASDEVRRRILVNKGQLSQQAYERDKAAADSAAAKLVAARAQERQAEDQAAYAVLFADADGVVMETSGEPGQVVAIGQAVVRLARDGAREAEVYVPESERAVGTGSATLYAEPGSWFLAKLREISAAADPQTRTFRARYVLDGRGRGAALGATVTIRLRRPIRDPDAVSVPAGALFDDGHGSKVWIVDIASSRLMARSVRILRVGDEDADVSGDLKPGDRVVAMGAHLLRSGERVGIDRLSTETAAR